MLEHKEAMEELLDWMEEHIGEEITLMDLAGRMGYSPGYFSSLFHRVVGMPLKRYLAGRRLWHAALAIRDSDRRILDIALDYGFSSQQSLTKAFVYAYGCSPAAYRRDPRPISVLQRRHVLFPADYEVQGGNEMSEQPTILTEARVRAEFIPAHRYLGIRESRTDAYFPFWEFHDCDAVCGVIDSMSYAMHPVVTCHTAGWFWEGGKRGFTYGLGVEKDYSGKIPKGFDCWDYPDSYYLVFYHPPFDFMKDGEEVYTRVADLAWKFDPASMGFGWNEEDCQMYYRHQPETLGLEILRPVRRIGKG